MRRFLRPTLVLLLVGVCCQQPATVRADPPGGRRTNADAVVDPALVGDWESLGSARKVTIHLTAKGAYRSVMEGAGKLPDETGTFRARDGNWSLTADRGPQPGRTDGGTYMMTDANTLVLVGKTELVVWKRAGTVPPLVQMPPPPAQPPAAAAGPKDKPAPSGIELMTTETSLGQTQNLTTSLPALSPDDRHQMYAVSVNGKTYVAIDGVLRREGYDQVDNLRFSPDGTRTAFTARRGTRWAAVIDGVAGPAADQVRDLRFSPDGKHVVYVLISNTTGMGGPVYRAVMDGQGGPAYDEVSDLTFSPDGRHVAYVADRGTASASHVDSVVVLDGKEGKVYPHIMAGTLCFNPASDRPAFVATYFGARSVMVIDGVEGPAAQEIHFSPDGKHVATVLSGNNKCSVALDGRPGKTYDATPANVTFSPDGRHLAYTLTCWPGGKVIEVVDGQEGPACDAVQDFQFGPDSTHFAYVARQGLMETCVTDAGAGKGYLRISDLLFSPDGKHLAYRGQRNDGAVVVCDGKEGKVYFQIPDHSICFSPDGKRLAYWAMLPGGMGVVVDGQEGKGYGNNGFAPGLAFSPDGKHLAYAATRPDSTGVVVVDGVEGPSFDRALDAPVVFDGPDRFHVLAVRGSDLIRLEVEIRQSGPAPAPPGPAK